MARAVGVDVGRLRAGAHSLKGAVCGKRPSADESHGFGSWTARDAVERFEAYWVSGQSSVDDSMAGLAGALSKAADAYEQRDAKDAVALRQGVFVGF
ncbi:type VII secretion target [Leifsonia sp. NPDC077715]|uniref:type VII secretion target n=1 Tax=Leifsonia sp. NPDC077715 TaxID=3155539 RepID=UPI0034209872